MAHFSGWIGAVVVAGIGQVVAGSLAYLVPVFRGSPFETNRRSLGRRVWLPLVTLNAAGLCLGFGLPVAAVALSAIWVIDLGIRLGRVSVFSKHR